ncbi:MAG: hypothetical protein WC511_01850 [Candidatus Pacearchaeota archaeon]
MNLNINCIHFNYPGICKHHKKQGWIFPTICTYIDRRHCDLQTKHPRPESPPPAQAPKVTVREPATIPPTTPNALSYGLLEIVKKYNCMFYNMETFALLRRDVFNFLQDRTSFSNYSEYDIVILVANSCGVETMIIQSLKPELNEAIGKLCYIYK